MGGGAGGILLKSPVISTALSLLSVEPLDWSAERQVLIPAEHSGVTSNADLEPKIQHQSPMTCTFTYMDKSIGTLPSLEEKKELSKLMATKMET